ncbi:hypothetical protein [Hyalangium rubrum]|uniref:Lipoprotein n=1 Tax=Hyalangium rubrum TaxID=3103134 RepID=A0ABU5H094_9BACT|nr:hypothetical protein [Hyalangium sp. s54d21]MDY7226522.1 hypothetical protein [Hyalangium sp. s54d21]
MRRQGKALCLMLALAACKGDDGTETPDAGPNPTDPNANSRFTRLTLDGAETDLQPLAMAVGPGDRIGVAYYFRVAGTANYEIRYVQVEGGQVSTPEKVDTVENVSALSVAFDSSGKAAVAYLGGGSDESVEWAQSDLEVAYRNGANNWSSSVPVTGSGQAPADNAVSNTGFLVGINPAIVFNGTTAYVAYRDGHSGQFEKQDWDGSDLELASGGPTNWNLRVLAAGGNNKAAYGGHINMVLGKDGQPALVHDQVSGSPDGTGSNVLFQRRNTDGSWTAPFQVQTVFNAQRGASLAWDATLGYGIAVVERSSSNRLTFVECKGNTATQCTRAADWTTPDPVYESGTGGWYPSLAIDPKTHDPSIAFYLCSNSPGANEGTCNANDDELRVTTRIEGNWREELVDADGGWVPKMAYLSTGERVIAYRAPRSGTLKLAVERVQ